MILFLNFNEKFKYVYAHDYTSTMTNITLSIPENLKEELQKHKEVNWSAVMRKALEEHLKRLEIAEVIAHKSKLTKKDVDELSKLIDGAVAKKLGLK